MKPYPIRTVILPVLASLAALVACDRQAPTAATDEADPTLSDKAGEMIDDAAITARVKTKLAADAGLSTIKLSVDTDNGVVTVCGKVPDEAMRDAVSRVAAGVAGVVLINNHVTVGP
ncbi:MAG: BON domain-containing protein [Paludibacterium sp.]|uniref:BON domain-containing protein n=1 Tax=Paludibacterium sp. TaxID=1917523 RepID=UPI0025DD828D|nr:BON domain-containing protein [Paludibacterium sp.]MBV8047601.1 BON domain-containing protein [Paludibacterium sp.]MBV8648219.1 BON domain-containing protein [Paludibacterium sp.]